MTSVENGNILLFVPTHYTIKKVEVGPHGIVAVARVQVPRSSLDKVRHLRQLALLRNSEQQLPNACGGRQMRIRAIMSEGYACLRCE